MSDNPSGQTRIFIWCAARSLSTVFTQSLSQVPDAYTLLEMYLSAAQFGPEGKNLQAYTYDGCSTDTHKSVKALFEQPWPGKSLVLGKDVGHVMDGKYEMIPQGYQHVFLIRHPSKSIASYASRIAATPAGQGFQIGLNQFKSLHDLHEYVTTTLGLKSTVLDADDLITSPQETLQKFCQTVGLPFSDKLLTWDWTDKIPGNCMMSQAVWEDHKLFGWYDTCLNSTGFIKPKEQLEKTVGEAEMTPEFKNMVVEALPYYEALRELRLKI